MAAVLHDKDWPMTDDTPALSADDLHLWLIPTRQPESVQNRAYAVLSTSEKARADRFRVPHARQQHIIAHAALRTLLGRYQQVPLSELAYMKGDHGKPVLVSNSHSPSLHFNLSHSGEYALLGLCRAHPLGVDIEQKHDLRDAAGLIKRFFTDEEAKAFADLSGGALLDRFFRLWTCKEALLKAEGLGIQGGLDSFVVDLQQDMLRSTSWHKPNHTLLWSDPDWLLMELHLPDHYAGAIACNQSIKHIKQMRFNDAGSY